MRVAVHVLCVVVLLSLSANAQEQPGAGTVEAVATPSEATPDPTESEVSVPAPSGAPGTPANGDVLHLKSGGTLDGVQVVRRTPLSIVVEVAEGVELSVPKSLVVSIDYDNIDPLKQRQLRKRGGGSQAQVVPGQELSPQMQAKLRADIGTPPLEYEDEDLIVVVEELAKRSGIPITVSAGVKEMEEEDREWTIKVEAGTTLFTLLQDSLLAKFPDLHVNYPYDKIEVTTKEEAGKKGEPTATNS